MAKKEQILGTSVSLGEFGTGKTEAGVYTIDKILYAIHPNKERTKYQGYVDTYLYDPEDQETIIIERDFAFFVMDKKGEKIGLLPQNSDGSIAGGIETLEELNSLLQIVRGDAQFDEGEEETFSGPRLMSMQPTAISFPGTVMRRSNWTQKYKSLVNAIGEDKITGDSTEIFWGYTLEWNREPQEGAKEGEGDKYDVLVAVAVVSEPKGAESGKKGNPVDSKSTVSSASTEKANPKSKSKQEPVDIDEDQEDTDNTDTDTEAPDDNSTDDNDESKVESIVLSLLKKNKGKKLKQGGATGWMSGIIMEAPAAMKPVVIKFKNVNPEWFYDDNRPWNSDEENLTIWL